jgi:AmiR/NasT family two-component response regulator
MSDEPLRVLIANESGERFAALLKVIAGLGHVVVASEIDVATIGEVTRRERPDVALVGLGEHSEHALDMIEKIVHEAACPVILLLNAQDQDFVAEAAARGVFAYIADYDAERIASALSIVLRRFAEYHNLEGAFTRRARIEQAKGILMARHALDEDAAFELIRSQSQRTGRKLIDVAESIVDSHLLLPPQPPAAAS